VAGAEASSDDAALYDPNRVLSIEIALPAEDWDALRTTGRDASTTATECRGVGKKIYSYYRARVTIDGTTLDGVGVRKKGYLGTLSVIRPSLKLELDAFAEGQRYRGVRRLTLNNNKQDPALMRTCLVYRVFRDAGIPAPRCNFARVSVNGTPLGIYSNVEPIKKPFLRRHFGDDGGTLYEGQLADFAPNWSVNFERKTNKKEGEGGEIAAVEQALSKPDDQLVAAISALIDYDEFLTFWAMETLVGHWDGYTNNRNNYFVYSDPTDRKLHFIPWGPDIGFTNNDVFHPKERPASVSADGAIARKLYADPGVRAEYVARMRKLLDSVWDEGALLAEVDRIDALLGGAPEDDGVVEIREFISGRKERLAKELADGGGEWTARERRSPCLVEGAAISGEFATKFGTMKAPNPMAEGKGHLNLTLGGNPIELALLGVVSGRDPNTGSQPAVTFVGLSGTSIYVVFLGFEEPLFKDGERQPFHGFGTWGLVLEIVKMRDPEFRGFLGSGAITLEQAGTSDGAPVKGSFTGVVYEPEPDAPAPPQLPRR